jgi:predicted dehydrogenase
LSSSERIRLVIIGAGKMGAAHAHAFAMVPEIEIVGIASRSGDTAAKLAAAVGVGATGTDWRELARRTRATAAVVAVSHEVNEAITGDVIDARLHVLSEKPVAFSSAAVDKLAARARAAGVIAMAAVNRRYYRAVLAALDEIRFAGDLLGATVFAPEPVRPQRARGNHAAFVYDHYTIGQTLHLIDLLRLAAGELVEVIGHARAPGGDEPNLAALLRFSTGAVVTYVAMSSSTTGWELRLHGERAEARLAPLEQGTIRIGTGAERKLPGEPYEQHKPGLVEQARGFADAILGDRIAYPGSDLADHARSVALAELIESLLAGR